MDRKRFYAAVSFLAFLALLVVFPWPRPTLSFSSVRDAEDRIRQAGFVCAKDGNVSFGQNGFLVSRALVSPDEISVLAKSGRFDLEKWKGKVWVTRINDAVALGFDENTAGYDFRVWGNVAAFGDREFLADVESAVRPRRDT